MENPVSSGNAAAGASSSLGARLVNVLAAPGQVFEEVKHSPPSHGNWLVPTVLLCLMGILYTWVVFSQPNIRQQIREQQEKVLEKRFANMPAEQREQAIAMAEKFSGPTMMKVSGTIGSLFVGFLQVLLFALLLWALGKLVFQTNFTFLKAMEVAGLAGIITVLSRLISMLLALITANATATLSPALFLREFDPTNLAHLLIGSLNVMTLWFLGVLAVGLAKLTGSSMLKPALLIYGFWAVFQVGLILLSWGVQHLVS